MQQIAQTQAHLQAAISTAQAITPAKPPTVSSQPQHPPALDADEMHVDEFSCDYADKSSNPKLPHYTGQEDPGIWSMQFQAYFLAHKTPTADQGAWMFTALRGTAMRYWFLEFRHESSTPENIIVKLKDHTRTNVTFTPAFTICA